LRIVFFGTPRFASIILQFLLNQKAEVAAVVTRPDKPKGRSSQPAFSPVKELALSHHLPLFQPSKASDPEFATFLKTLHADFFVVAAYAEILKPSILEIPRLGCINVHGSNLPKYRGAAPVQRAIMAGETETGVTIMKMAEKMDEGDILSIRKVPIPLEMNAGELMDILANTGKEALWEAMLAMEKGSLKPIKQDSSLATYAKKIKPEDAEILWNGPNLAIHNQIRGVNPNPGAWCWVEVQGEKKRLLLKRTLPCPSSIRQPGMILSTNPSELIVGCTEGAVRILELQLEGRKTLPADVFLRGINLDKLLFLTR
jgi:methionyl-tRNA formyltransferase